jgi:hypothetical protein
MVCCDMLSKAFSGGCFGELAVELTTRVIVSSIDFLRSNVFIVLRLGLVLSLRSHFVSMIILVALVHMVAVMLAAIYSLRPVGHIRNELTLVQQNMTMHGSLNLLWFSRFNLRIVAWLC